MICKVYKKEDFVGEISLGSNGSFQLSNCEKEFEAYMRELLSKEVELKRCINDTANNSHVLVETRVDAEDPLFPLAIRDHLSSQGYYVVEVRTDLDEKIKQLAFLGLPEKEAQKICTELPTMTYFEKSFLFEKFKEIIENIN